MTFLKLSLLPVLGEMCQSRMSYCSWSPTKVCCVVAKLPDFVLNYEAAMTCFSGSEG